MAEHSNFRSVHNIEEIPEQTNSAPPNTSVNYARTIAAFAILLGCLGLGATLAAIFWSSTYSRLQADLRHSQEEHERIKTEYAKYREEHPAGAELRIGKVSSNAIEIRLMSGTTATLFGDDLRISLIGVEFVPEPSRYRINATVVSPGHTEMKIGKAEVGYIANYSNGNEFDIQVLSADAFSASLLIVRKEH